jgi:hypothetical protein
MIENISLIFMVSLQDGACFHFRVCLGLFKGETVEQPAQLPAANGYRYGTGVCRPLEFPPLQPSIMEPKPAAIPLENFEFIALSVAENKEAVGEGIQFETFFDKHRQPVNGLAQICSATGEINPFNTDFVQYNVTSTWTISESRSGSKPDFTSMQAPPTLISMAVS